MTEAAVPDDLAPAPVPEPPAIPAPRPEPSLHKMHFTGTGSEYFRIWIVNLALTILTLGVYSAWAKVRRLQYFYRHTRLAGAGFDYHAEPFALLKGRLVGLVLFGLYYAIGYVQFRVALAILAVLATVVPWLLSRSLKFRMRNTSYRGIRFRFSGTTREAYWQFLMMPILTVLSLFVIGPLWHQRIKRYQFSHTSFGATPFTFRAPVGDFYIAYVVAFASLFAFVFVAIIIGTIVAIGAGVAAAAGGDLPDPANRGNPFVVAMTAVILVIYGIGVIAVQAIMAARLHNAVWNTTTLDGHGFICEISWFRLFGIQLTNLLATVLTLGLFRPFAQVRLARFFAAAFMLATAGSIDALQAADSEDVSAVGEEAAGFFDLDIGF